MIVIFEGSKYELDKNIDRYMLHDALNVQTDDLIEINPGKRLSIKEESEKIHRLIKEKKTKDLIGLKFKYFEFYGF